MIKSNYHTHTERCGHASGKEEDYVISAINNNLSILGFSDHGPFEDAKHDFRMDFSDFHNYIESINNLKSKYKNKINILSAVEIEFLENEQDYYESLLTKYNLDYLLLGQHMWLHNNEIFYPDDCSTKSEDFFGYCNSLCKAMDSKLFKIIAHPDYFLKTPLEFDKNFEKITYDIINCAVKNDSILEFNAHGIRKGLSQLGSEKRYIYPCKTFWDNVKQTNLRVIINSDCHNPEDVWDESMEKAHALAKEWGIKNIISEV